MFRVTTLDLENLPRTEDDAIDYSKDFFGKSAYLTVSGQLQGEAMAMAFGKIYTFGPTFRAEQSYTARHAAEFWMIEPEIAFADLEDDMILAENMLKYVIRYVMENAPEEMNFFNSFVDKGLLERLNHVLNSDFGHVTYTEAIKILEEHNDEFDYKVYWGCDLHLVHFRIAVSAHAQNLILFRIEHGDHHLRGIFIWQIVARTVIQKISQQKQPIRLFPFICVKQLPAILCGAVYIRCNHPFHLSNSSFRNIQTRAGYVLHYTAFSTPGYRLRSPCIALSPRTARSYPD